MQVIANHKVVNFDVDDTLVLWNRSEYSPTAKSISVKHKNFTSTLPVHTEHVNLMVKLIKIGYDIVVWSRSGYEWAQAVVEELMLQDYIPEGMHERITIMSKPTLIVDDQDPAVWIGEQVYREPVKAIREGVEL